MAYSFALTDKSRTSAFIATVVLLGVCYLYFSESEKSTLAKKLRNATAEDRSRSELLQDCLRASDDANANNTRLQLELDDLHASTASAEAKCVRSRRRLQTTARQNQPPLPVPSSSEYCAAGSTTSCAAATEVPDPTLFGFRDDLLFDYAVAPYGFPRLSMESFGPRVLCAKVSLPHSFDSAKLRVYYGTAGQPCAFECTVLSEFVSEASVCCSTQDHSDSRDVVRKDLRLIMVLCNWAAVSTAVFRYRYWRGQWSLVCSYATVAESVSDSNTALSNGAFWCDDRILRPGASLNLLVGVRYFVVLPVAWILPSYMQRPGPDPLGTYGRIKGPELGWVPLIYRESLAMAPELSAALSWCKHFGDSQASCTLLSLVGFVGTSPFYTFSFRVSTPGVYSLQLQAETISPLADPPDDWVEPRNRFQPGFPANKRGCSNSSHADLPSSLSAVSALPTMNFAELCFSTSPQWPLFLQPSVAFINATLRFVSNTAAPCFREYRAVVDRRLVSFAAERLRSVDPFEPGPDPVATLRNSGALCRTMSASRPGVCTFCDGAGRWMQQGLTASTLCTLGYCWTPLDARCSFRTFTREDVLRLLGPEEQKAKHNLQWFGDSTTRELQENLKVGEVRVGGFDDWLDTGTPGRIAEVERILQGDEEEGVNRQRVAVVNCGLHDMAYHSFASYVDKLPFLLDRLVTFRKQTGARVLWRATSATAVSKKNRPMDCYVTLERQRIFNAYATAEAQIRGLPVFDAFAMTAPFRLELNKARDPIHWHQIGDIARIEWIAIFNILEPPVVNDEHTEYCNPL